MAETAIIWSNTSGHMRVGVKVRWDNIGPSTTSTHVWADFYVMTPDWSYRDNQRINYSGNISGGQDYYANLDSGEQMLVDTVDLGVKATSYSGCPSWRLVATVSGAYDGSAPRVDYTFTLPARPASVPGAPPVSVDSVTSNSARVFVSGAASNGSPILEYQGVMDNSSDFSSPFLTWSGGTRYVTALAATSTYYTRVRARNSVGWGPWSTVRSFTTGATTPGVPGSVAVGSIGSESATLSWTAPATGGSAINGYDVQFATDGGFTQNLLTYLDVSASPFTSTELIPGRTYYARVRAVNGVGNGSYSSAVTFLTLVGTPIIQSPSEGAIVSTGAASVSVYAPGVDSGKTITVQLSKDSTFTTGVSTLTLNPSGVAPGSIYTLQDSALYLSNGVWYARSRVSNNTTGYITPWSTVVSYTQSHNPSVSIISPTGNSRIKYSSPTVFTWRFQDASSIDRQTYYRLIVENNATGEVVYDSTKTAFSTAGPNVSVSIPISSSYKGTVLRWKIQVWDRGDTQSAWSGYSLFTLSDPPVVTVTSPSPGSTVSTGSPTFAWNVVVPSVGSQASAVIRVYDSEDNSLVWERTIIGTDATVTPPVVILRNTRSYYFTISVTDTNGLSSSVSQSFTVAYTAPDTIVYDTDVSLLDSFGYIVVDWTATDPDPLFAEWKVYRRAVDYEDDWKLLDTISDQNVRSYRDYMLVAGVVYSYSVTQVASRSGDELESPVGYHRLGLADVLETRAYLADISSYWLLNPDDFEMSVKITGVSSDDTTDEYETSSYNIIGRGRHVDYGDRLGYSGTLTCKVRSNERPSSFRLKIEALRKANETYYLRTPFGRLIKVSLGDIGWSPIAGVGTAEMGDMTIPYLEVS